MNKITSKGSWKRPLICNQKRPPSHVHHSSGELKYARKILFMLILLPLTSCNWNTTIETKNEREVGSGNSECAGNTSDDAVRRRISIVPQFSATTIHAAYWPVLTQIGKKANLCFELVQQESIPDFEEALRNKEADYAFMNPYHQVMFKKEYKPLLRDSKKLLTGIIVINRKSTASTLEDLDGAELLLPAPNAFAASLLTRALFDQQGIEIKPRYVKTHQNVYRGVARNTKVAGGGVNKTYTRESKNLQAEVMILQETPGHPAHPFSASKSMPLQETKAIQSLWIEMAKQPEWKTLLEKVQIPFPMRADYQRDYAPLAGLGLERFVE
ncbi:phosphate/phosphite/phosphonate ABC transporter substrate-binding protein [Synechococcus sp. KORDI-52]|uniref:phosphate/phosphite/phosphonate ABC transporter substrate-binding protein n=1 Tax=Synechococcus sp. KORDI-52 TaxID=585425 RepID=UPI001C1DFFFD|nr:phosphate/phosphite/phosphonate ABC transporter substrate-binding protein [Synechococcus sp. KORDI-52]